MSKTRKNNFTADYCRDANHTTTVCKSIHALYLYPFYILCTWYNGEKFAKTEGCKNLVFVGNCPLTYVFIYNHSARVNDVERKVKEYNSMSGTPKLWPRSVMSRFSVVLFDG